MSLLDCERIEKSFNGIKALSEFSCELKEKEILGLIGPNGAGKTTFFNVLSGFIPPDRGKVFFRKKDILSFPSYKIVRMGISRTFQLLRLVTKLTVLENVLLSFQEQPGEKLNNIFFKWQKCKEIESRNLDRAVNLLEQYGLGGKLDDLADTLSYGQQKLLSLVCCLAAGADLILLDEPVAGIQPDMIEKILEVIKTLPKQGKSAIIIEHNIDAIDRVCDRVIFMDSGKKVCEGLPLDVRNDPRAVDAYID